MASGLAPLEAAVRDSQDAFMGSEQERTALDKAYVAQTALVRDLNLLEEDMVPAGYEAPVPDDYSDLAQLKGRATVEFVFQKPDGGVFDIGGVNFKEAKMVMVIDGYTGACVRPFCVCLWYLARVTILLLSLSVVVVL